MMEHDVSQVCYNSTHPLNRIFVYSIIFDTLVIVEDRYGGFSRGCALKPKTRVPVSSKSHHSFLKQQKFSI